MESDGEQAQASPVQDVLTRTIIPHRRANRSLFTGSTHLMTAPTSLTAPSLKIQSSIDRKPLTIDIAAEDEEIIVRQAPAARTPIPNLDEHLTTFLQTMHRLLSPSTAGILYNPGDSPMSKSQREMSILQSPQSNKSQVEIVEIEPVPLVKKFCAAFETGDFREVQAITARYTIGDEQDKPARTNGLLVHRRSMSTSAMSEYGDDARICSWQVMKFGRRGKPIVRVLTISLDDGEVDWGSARGNQINVGDIRQVRKGRQTEVFLRSSDGLDDDEGRFVSIVTPRRTLDLQLNSRHERNQFVSDVRRMVSHYISEQQDEISGQKLWCHYRTHDDLVIKKGTIARLRQKISKHFKSCRKSSKSKYQISGQSASSF